MHGRKWTRNEQAYLRNNYAKIPVKRIALHLDRSRTAIYDKARSLKLQSNWRKWTEDQTMYLKRNYGKMLTKNIALHLNKSRSSIKNKIRRLNLRSNLRGTGKRWSNKEINYLKKNHKNSTATKIASRLGRSFPSVVWKAKALGLKFKEIVFSKTPSEDLAYVLGVIHGDGCLSKCHHQYAIILHVKDECFARTFANSLEKLKFHSNVYTSKNYRTNTMIYRAVVYSKQLYEWFKSLNLPETKKLLKTRGMKQKFIRGFYDSEGSLSIDKYGNRKPQIVMGVTNKKLIKFVKSLLEDLDFSPKLFKRKSFGLREQPFMMFYLRVQRSQSKRFLLEIGSSIPRKSITRLTPSIFG